MDVMVVSSKDKVDSWHTLDKFYVAGTLCMRQGNYKIASFLLPQFFDKPIRSFDLVCEFKRLFKVIIGI